MLAVVMALSLVVVAGADDPVSGTVKLIVDGELNEEKTIATYTISIDTSECVGVAAIQFFLTPGEGMTFLDKTVEDYDNVFKYKKDAEAAPGDYSFTITNGVGKYYAYGGKLPTADDTVGHYLKPQATPYKLLTVRYNVTNGRGTLGVSDFIGCKSGSEKLIERYTCDAPTSKSVGLMLGDVNKDGRVTIADVIRLLNHVNKSDPFDDASHCDINGDNRVTIADVIRLLNHVNKSDPLY